MAYTKNHKLNGLSYTVAIFALLFAADAATAQVVPNTIDPGRQEKRLTPAEKPDISNEPLVEPEGQAPRKGSADDKVKFTLKSVSVQGATDVNEASISSITREYIGKEVSLSYLHEMADRVTAKLRNDGYVLSRAIIPPQKVGDGEVVLKVVGGHVSKVTVESDKKSRRDLVGAYADNIKDEKPLNFKSLERNLLLADDLPGVTARGYLRPSGTPGASDLVIKTTHKPVEGSVGIDNRGSKYMGPWEGNFNVKFNNILGIYEQTGIRGNLTSDPDELKYFEINHQEQLNGIGTKLNLAASYVDSEPSSTLAPLNIEGKSRGYSAGVSHPFIRSRSTNLIGDATLDYRNVESNSPFVPSYEDEIRAVRIGGTFDFVDFFSGLNRLNVTGSRGLDFDVDETLPHSRANAEQKFTKLNFDFSHVQHVHGPVSVEIRASGQASDDALFASEEFGVGGAYIGSAYDSFEISGDEGIAGRAELQFNQDTKNQFVPFYQLYSFYDAGKVWNNETVVGEPEDAGLTDAGLGVRFNVIHNVSGGLEVAFPISRDVQAEGDKDARLFTNLSWRF